LNILNIYFFAHLQLIQTVLLYISIFEMYQLIIFVLVVIDVISIGRTRL